MHVGNLHLPIPTHPLPFTHKCDTECVCVCVSTHMRHPHVCLTPLPAFWCMLVGAASGLVFGEAPSGHTRLFSVGTDCRLIEYDLAAATSHNAGLSPLRVLQLASPGSAGSATALCFAPPLPYFSAAALDTLLLMAGECTGVHLWCCRGNAGIMASHAVRVVPPCAPPQMMLSSCLCATQTPTSTVHPLLLTWGQRMVGQLHGCSHFGVCCCGEFICVHGGGAG